MHQTFSQRSVGMTSEAETTLNATDCTTEQCYFLYVSLTVFYFDNEQAAMLQNYVVCVRVRRRCDIQIEASHHSKLSSFCKINKMVK